ncbi:hypothetical protein HAX54_028214 [Datura stramonium]|uniref:Uncharacterized protein n=1 Tax=Datura stramonium TaxID=4076 RepID=A0ABS8V4Y2_DATST|nr:hypothetical protein [Datura stramonium]
MEEDEVEMFGPEASGKLLLGGLIQKPENLQLNQGLLHLSQELYGSRPRRDFPNDRTEEFYRTPCRGRS